MSDGELSFFGTSMSNGLIDLRTCLISVRICVKQSNDNCRTFRLQLAVGFLSVGQFSTGYDTPTNTITNRFFKLVKAD